jgi:hypothetical protein
VELSLSEDERALVALGRDFAQNEIARQAPAAWQEAEPRDGGWVINGRKAFISNAGKDMSFGVRLLARTESGDGSAGEESRYASFVVDGGYAAP